MITPMPEDNSPVAGEKLREIPEDRGPSGGQIAAVIGVSFALMVAAAIPLGMKYGDYRSNAEKTNDACGGVRQIPTYGGIAICTDGVAVDR